MKKVLFTLLFLVSCFTIKAQLYSDGYFYKHNQNTEYIDDKVTVVIGNDGFVMNVDGFEMTFVLEDQESDGTYDDSGFEVNVFNGIIFGGNTQKAVRIHVANVYNDNLDLFLVIEFEDGVMYMFNLTKDQKTKTIKNETIYQNAF